MVQRALQRPAARRHARAAHARATYPARRPHLHRVPHAGRAHARVPHARAHARPRLHQHALHALRPDALHDAVRDHAASAGLPDAGGTAPQAGAGVAARIHGAVGLAEGGRRLGAAQELARHALHAAQ